jgi:FMN phosphatase YigB (HAD superfamily)
MFDSFRKKPAPAVLDLEPIEAVWFDLDGTLIEVDMERFIPAYLRRLADRLAPYAEPQRALKTLRTATLAMLGETDGTRTLEELLRDQLAGRLQLPWEGYREALVAFCREDLPELQPLVRPHPLARELVESCLARGWQVVLATNPIFPREVVAARLAWGDLADLPFAPITSYENSRYCKPHSGFFHDLITQLDLPPRACLMVGNDSCHDLAAGRVGMPTCLLTTWRIDREPGFVADWEGGHPELLEQLRPG